MDRTKQGADGRSVAPGHHDLGMHHQPPLDLDLAELPHDAIVCDIVYAPLETPLLAAANAWGNPVVGGLGMLGTRRVPALLLGSVECPMSCRVCASDYWRILGHDVLGLDRFDRNGKEYGSRHVPATGAGVRRRSSCSSLVGQRWGPPLVAAAFPGVVVEVRSIAGSWAHAFSECSPPANSNASCTRSWRASASIFCARPDCRVGGWSSSTFRCSSRLAASGHATRRRWSRRRLLQYARLLQRPGMSPERIAIMRWQMPDEESDGAPTSSS